MATNVQPQVLPKEVRLSAPPTMPQARSYLFRQQPTSVGSATPSGGTITINLPRLQRSYLTKDSYLRFQANITYNPGTSTAPVNFAALDQPGAYSFINKIEVFDYLGSTLLESTAGHGQLMALLMDLHTSNDQRNTIHDVNTGMRAGIMGSEWGSDTTGFTANVVQKSPSTGEVFYTDVDAGGAQTIRKELAIPVMSFLGLLSDKFAPLHNGYTIVFTLNTAQDALIYGAIAGGTAVTTNGATTAIDYTISDVYYECQVLELGPVAESMLLSSTQGQPLVVASKAYRQYIGSIPSGSSSFKLDINLNVASLTNILWFMRSTGIINNSYGQSANVFQQYKATLSSRVRNYLQNWYFQYGSSILPQTSGITARTANGADAGGGFTECFAELLKARHQYATGDTFTTIDEYTYAKDLEDSIPRTVFAIQANCPGKFAAGLDLELVSGKSQEIISGLNTNGMNTSIQLNFDPYKVTAMSSAVLDLFAEYDAFINIAPGLATTVSF